MRAHQVLRWKLPIATTACELFLKEKLLILFFKTDGNTDSAVTMRKMILAKILKNTWLVLFAEIIVSDKGNV